MIPKEYIIEMNIEELENVNSNKIPNQLINKDILSKMEEGTNSTSTNKNI